MYLRAAAILLVGAGLGFFCAVWFDQTMRNASTCELLDEEPPMIAPAGVFVAQVVHSACGGPLGGTYLPVKVMVWRADAPGVRREVAGWEAGGAGALAWIGPTALEMRIANPWGARLRPTPFAGLAVTVTVDPPARDRPE